jgi:hypothetical protein
MPYREEVDTFSDIGAIPTDGKELYLEVWITSSTC